MTKKAQYWIDRIDKILNKDERFVFDKRPSAKETLEGIQQTIRDTGQATDNQIQAIKNIKWGRN